MANVKLSVEGEKYLLTIMDELEIDISERSHAIRLAFSKGIAADSCPVERNTKPSKIEFPISVVAKNDNSLLIKHLMIEKLQRKITTSEMKKYILLFVEHGLETMYSEIQSLSSADNYLLYLLDKHAVS